jgi:hypothetical protein
MRCMNLLVGALMLALLVTGCDRENAQRRQEQRANDCLYKFCPGDVVPERDMATEVAIKLNGQWYLGPKEHFSTGRNGGGFYWPSRHPMFKGGNYPEEGQDHSAKAIETFLRHHDGVMHGPTQFAFLKQAEAEGRLISKITLRPGLEVWRIREDGPSYVWYIATEHVDKDPNGAVLACRDNDPKYDRCTTGFIWKPGIAADMRFRATHAPDWPDIYQETIRILNLLRKA